MNAKTGGEAAVVHADLSYRIMSAAFDVHRVLGPGYAERIYEQALAREFEERGIAYERQKRIEIEYKGLVVGEYFLDMVVEDSIVLELKATPEITALYCAQALSYLKASGMRLAIVINFGARSVKNKRIVL